MKHLYLNEETQRVSILDNRFYKTETDEFYPGVTTVLDAYPKGGFYTQWLKEMGNAADTVIQKAFDLGSEVHNAIDSLTKGKELKFMDANGNSLFTYEAWLMVSKFYQFSKHVRIISSEQVVLDHQHKLGGTVDLICEIDGERWLIDYKTSKAIYKTNQIQLAAYRSMLADDKIMKHGVLWLNAATRTEKSFTQGKGWQLISFSDSYEKDLELFRMTHRLWLEENDKYNPNNVEFDNVLKLTLT